jgi:hypothetical protein
MGCRPRSVRSSTGRRSCGEGRNEPRRDLSSPAACARPRRRVPVVGMRRHRADPLRRAPVRGRCRARDDVEVQHGWRRLMRSPLASSRRVVVRPRVASSRRVMLRSQARVGAQLADHPPQVALHGDRVGARGRVLLGVHGGREHDPRPTLVDVRRREHRPPTPVRDAHVRQVPHPVVAAGHHLQHHGVMRRPEHPEDRVGRGDDPVDLRGALHRVVGEVVQRVADGLLAARPLGGDHGRVEARVTHAPGQPADHAIRSWVALTRLPSTQYRQAPRAASRDGAAATPTGPG